MTVVACDFVMVAIGGDADSALPVGAPHSDSGILVTLYRLRMGMAERVQVAARKQDVLGLDGGNETF